MVLILFWRISPRGWICCDGFVVGGSTYEHPKFKRFLCDREVSNMHLHGGLVVREVYDVS
jgi:hypothetical protein